MKTRPGASMCAGVKQGVNEMLIYFRRHSGARAARTRNLEIPGPREDACPGMTGKVRQFEMLLIWLTV